MKQDSHQRARELWQDATDAMSEQRSRMVEDLNFSNPSDPQQWDDGIKRARETDVGGARPCFVFDQTNQYIQQVVNDGRMNKPQILVVPVDSGADVKTAEAINGLIRHTEYRSSASIAYDTALDHAARVGRGWIRIVPRLMDGEWKQQEVFIDPVVDPLTVKPDPAYLLPDGSDMTHGFVETRMPKRMFERQYKGKRTAGWEGADAGWFDDDSVRICEFFDQVETKENRVVIEHPETQARTTLSEDEYWQLAGQISFKPPVVATYASTSKAVKWSKMSGCEMLEETDFPSRWVPLVPVHGYELWIEGKRYLCGMVRRMMPAARAYNMERSAEIEAMALQPRAPYLAAWESISEHETAWKRSNTSNPAYLPYDAFTDDGQPLPPPQRMMPPTMGSAYAQMGMKAVADLQAAVGMYRANLGAPSNETSGIAIKRREQQGDTANFHFQDNLSRSLTHTGRILIDIFPRVYDQPQQARILQQDGTSEPVQIDPAAPKAYDKPKGQPAVINLTAGTYDVRVKVGPAYASLREEAADALTKIVQSSPALMPILGPMWARMQDWPEAEKVSKLLLAVADPRVQAIESSEQEIPPEAQAQIQQLTQAKQQLEQALQNAAQQHQELEQQVAADVHGAQLKAQAAQSLEAMKGDIALALQQAKNEGAHNVEELKGLVQMLLQHMQPDPAVADGGEDPPGTPEESTQPA